MRDMSNYVWYSGIIINYIFKSNRETAPKIIGESPHYLKRLSPYLQTPYSHL